MDQNNLTKKEGLSFMALTKCTECGHEISESASACPNCGHPITTKISSEKITPDKCPKCGSENIQKYSLYKKSQKREVIGMGCLTHGMGCIIFLLLLIFAPCLLLLLGIGFFVILPLIIIVAIIGGVIYVLQESYNSHRYICLKCENIFKA
jgi:predicted RNA-binding Zn-ribbon protein involved in translation (DUF1610 family)